MPRTQLSILDRIMGAITAGFAALQGRTSRLDQEVQNATEIGLSNSRKLDQILSILQEPTEVAGTVLTVSKGDTCQ